ncbi:MAG TPA: SMC-Scp complex subunit ScpB [Candidatus Andersenbacteria bacterium]|nr:SMC-Scp complex subunit ScpB [Candidatus Andersenbacteria bacterium]
MNQISQRIEALLFTAGEAVPKTELQELTKTSEGELTAALQELEQHTQESGLTIIITATHVQLVTSPNVAGFLAQFNKDTNHELSKAALETLSLIAYRGPLVRFEIDAIRGVDSTRIIRQLFLRGLVRQLRMSSKAPQYDVTEEFLSHLGITTKHELPNFTELAAHNLS